MTARQRLAELRDQAVRKIVVTLVTYEGGLRLRPATIERLRAIVSDLLLAARQIVDLYAGQPEEQPTEDELADTRPMRTRPPPPPPPKPKA